ncbi:MAG: hypothetical protein ACW98Y_03965 [Candidatus Thorarchaeota archaeon]|jgi:hypothetical protein
MKKAEEKLYTPIVLRTGFLHSYRRTILLLLTVIILEAVFWSVGGFWPRFDDFGLMRWGLIIILAIVVPIGTRTIRDIVAGYRNLFNLFDERTEKNLKLYRSMASPSSESQEGMRTLFKDEEAYSAFQDRARQVIFEKISQTSTLVSIITVTIVVLYNIAYEKIILRAAMARYPLSILEVVIDSFASIFLILSLSFIFLFGTGYLFTISRLGASKSDFAVWNYIEHLRGASVKDSSFMSYWRFHDYASTIGRHFSGIAFRIVLLAVLSGITQIIYNTSTPTFVTWILALLPIALSALVLALPLNSLHRVMRDAKDAVLKELEVEYDHLTVRFVSHLSEQRQSGTTERKREDNDLAMKITSLKGIIEETKQQWTWPVRIPMVLQIVTTSMIPVVYIFLEELFRVVGIL